MYVYICMEKVYAINRGYNGKVYTKNIDLVVIECLLERLHCIPSYYTIIDQ